MSDLQYPPHLVGFQDVWPSLPPCDSCLGDDSANTPQMGSENKQKGCTTHTQT